MTMFYRTPFLLASLVVFAAIGCDRPDDTITPADSTVVETDTLEVITTPEVRTTPDMKTSAANTKSPGMTTTTPDATTSPDTTSPTALTAPEMNSNKDAKATADKKAADKPDAAKATAPATKAVVKEVESKKEADKKSAETKTATCELVSIGDSGVKGTIKLVQTGDTVKITGKVTGLTPGLHGFHVHEKGDLSDTKTGASAGGHFNPTNQPHGKPTDKKRHVGDLGNIEADKDGVANIDMQDKVISLSGENSIVGKALLIHEGEDKFTQPVGDAGGRVAFGKIELQ